MKSIALISGGVAVGACLPAGTPSEMAVGVVAVMACAAILRELGGVMADRDRRRPARSVWPSPPTGVRMPPVTPPRDERPALITTGPGGVFTKRHESDSILELLGEAPRDAADADAGAAAEGAV